MIAGSAADRRRSNEATPCPEFPYSASRATCSTTTAATKLVFVCRRPRLQPRNSRSRWISDSTGQPPVTIRFSETFTVPERLPGQLDAEQLPRPSQAHIKDVPAEIAARAKTIFKSRDCESNGTSISSAHGGQNRDQLCHLVRAAATHGAHVRCRSNRRPPKLCAASANASTGSSSTMQQIAHQS